jgi:hypothetical protein
MKEELIAPCGMNCNICSGYLAYLNDVKSKDIGMPYCAGCRPRGKNCAFLKKRCNLLMDGKVEYCYQCPDCPCDNLKHIDNRYQSLYRMSLIDNLEYIRQNGIESLLAREEEKWRCPECGESICCHNGICFNCGIEKLRSKKKPYRWEDE